MKEKMIKHIINKIEFDKLDFDDKCVIIEQLLTDDYFNGQMEINYWLPENFDGTFLPETPPVIKAEEDKKFKKLIDDLTLKLFVNSDEIEFNDEYKIINY